MSTVTLDLSGDAKNIVDSFSKAADSVSNLNDETKEFDKTSKKAFSDATKASDAFGKSIEDGSKPLKKEIGILQQIENDLKDLKKARLEANDTASIKKLNKEIDEQEKKMNKLTGTTKQAGFSFKEIAKGALAFTGISAGISLVQSGFRKVIKTVADYDQATSQLKAITGLDGKEFDAFDAKIKKVASSTRKSAVDVAKAFQLIGSADASLLTSADALGNVTEAAITLAKAGGLEVPEAATALTKAMNQYGAVASDATEFTDIFAASQQKGTATIAELSESMKNVGAVANAAGVSFKDTTIALQALAKGGLTGAEAGTGLRSVYSKLANQGRDELNPTLTSMTDIIKTLSGENIGLKEASALVGEESAKTLLTLIAQEQTLNDLTVAMDDVSGSASDQAITATANVNDRWEEFNNTIDNAIIQFGSGENALSGFISRVIAVGTEIVNLITGNAKLTSELTESEKRTREFAETFIFVVKTIATLVAAFKAYQLAMRAGLAIQKAITVAVKAFEVAQQLVTNGLKGARVAQLAFNAAASANPIGIIITIVLAAAAAYVAFGQAVDESALAQESFNKAQERASQIAKKRIAVLNEGTAARIKALENEKILAVAAGANEEKLNKKFLEDKQKILEEEQILNKKRANTVEDRVKDSIDATQKEIDAIQKLQDEAANNTISTTIKESTTAGQIQAKQLQDRKLALIQKLNTEKGNAVGIFQALRDNDKAIAEQIKEANFQQEVITAEGNKALSEEEKKAAEKRAKEKEAALKKLQALEQKYQDDLAKLAADAEKERIDDLEGEDRFLAEERLRNKEIDAIKENLEEQRKALGKGGELLQTQQEQLQLLRDKAAQDRINKTMKFNEDELKADRDYWEKSLDLQESIAIEEAMQFSDSALSFEEIERAKQLRILEIQQEFAAKRLAGFGDNLSEEDKLIKLQLQNQSNAIADEIDKLNNQEGFSMAKLLGVTDEEFTAIKDSLNVIGSAVLEQTQNLFAAQQEANQALIDGLNERIDEVESELDRELEYREQGFASNVEGKAEELAQLKAQREQAQKDAESLAKKQFALDTAIQASSLITSAANIIKATSSITPPFGQILAGIAIGAISALFISAKLKAFQAIKAGGGAQAATGASGKGKTGKIHGKRHSQGGENFIDQIEVEEGEPWAVLNRKVSNEDAERFHLFAKGLNDGRNSTEMIQNLLKGTGVTLDKKVPKKLEAKQSLIIQKQVEHSANLTSDKMVELLGSLDGNLDEFINFSKNKKQIIPTSWGRIEIENGKQTKIKELK